MNRLSRGGRHAVLVVALAAGVSGGLAAQGGRAMMRPEDVPWPSAQAGGAGTSGAGGIETVVLKGDPAKPGLYTLMLRVGPNVRIQAHSHRDDRVATVVRGTWHYSATETRSTRRRSGRSVPGASTPSRPTCRTSR